MNPTQHPSNNFVLGAPPDWDQTGPVPCRALAATRALYPNGEPVILSYWRPSAADLAALNAGALLELAVAGGAHPPVWIGVEGVP